MSILVILVVALVVLLGGGTLYSRYLARAWGEDAARPTPAVARCDWRDYVPTPTPVVFAHHFASIAGAGPIVGPVIALAFGWLPGLIWVLVGGLLIGGVHDYLAAFMSTREGGDSMATIARRLLGRGPFIAFMLFLIITLALVCASFLDLSAKALVSMVPHLRLDLPDTQTLFRVVGEGATRQVVIGGIASTSVIVITLCAPLVGWMYIKKQVAVWKCSLLAIAICAVSIVAGLYLPVALPPNLSLAGVTLTGTNLWKLILAAYVLLAAALPVWLFLQSRDFINVHLLYCGLAVLVAALVTAAFRGGLGVSPAEAIPAVDLVHGRQALGAFWPALFITIACGAVSGFHSLCAGGTTCKQLMNETATRKIGYWGMILETTLAVAVICVMVIGFKRLDYYADVHPVLAGLTTASNPVLGFAMGVGNTLKVAFGLPLAVGALAGMVLLEGFVVTTLDTAIRLTRYLFEEIWKALFDADLEDAAGNLEPAGAGGVTAPTLTGLFHPHSRVPKVLQYCWTNSGIAVALTLVFTFSASIMQLWKIFATANQLLAALVLLMGTLWLVRHGRPFWMAVVPAVFMLATTFASLIVCLQRYWAEKPHNVPLIVADVLLMALAAYLLIAGAQMVLRRAAPATKPAPG